MAKGITLVIVDDNPDFVELIREALEQESDIHIIGTAYNGIDALTLIRSKKPDMVLLDVVMPEKDGLEVLEELQKSKIKEKPIIMMLTAIGQDHYIRRALNLGAEFYFIKPFDLTLLAKRLRQIHHDISESAIKADDHIVEKKGRHIKSITRDEIEEHVTLALQEMSVPPHLTGYLYVKRAIALTIVSMKGFIPATKELYPTIAEEFGTTPGKIERAIRGSIQKAWTRKDQSNASQYFTYAGKYTSIKPTNSEFIATVAGKIRQILRIEN